jgi:hypothetical protein
LAGQNRERKRAARKELSDLSDQLARFEVRRNASVETYQRKYQEVLQHPPCAVQSLTTDCYARRPCTSSRPSSTLLADSICSTPSLPACWWGGCLCCEAGSLMRGGTVRQELAESPVVPVDARFQEAFKGADTDLQRYANARGNRAPRPHTSHANDSPLQLHGCGR